MATATTPPAIDPSSPVTKATRRNQWLPFATVSKLSTARGIGPRPVRIRVELPYWLVATGSRLRPGVRVCTLEENVETAAHGGQPETPPSLSAASIPLLSLSSRAVSRGSK
ncbi:hypothetical protein GUJ93_ZPchr0001g31708 [Zizania palustris]|uniref:Uncharacterized protein n=1 Tax=Zizania palustris TaxID=103762 RepID=A0A8J5S9X3_ZIZPA|nr:hypothetical protein GUJ93_ZPchr0001g31708 [Zizania palustris]